VSGLTDAFAINLQLYLPRRCTFVVPGEDGQLLAILTRRPPEGVPSSVLSIVRSGLPRFAVRNGLGAVRRAFWMKDAYHRIEGRVAGGVPHWFFTMMAVRPDARGHRLGVRLFARLLETALGAPSMLITNQEANAKRFAPLGFQIASSHEIAPPGERPYTAWCMRRPAP
jgi:GNAT superfamily N-acetyltransferase